MSIQERQNSHRSLTLLAAQRLLYSRSKKTRNIATAIVITVAVVGLIASLVSSQYFERFLPSFVLLSWLFDQQFLKKKEQTLRTEAATLQEAFDCSVLDLPWPRYKGIQPPTEDRIKQLAAVAQTQNRELLRDWYPPDEIPANPVMAKLHCQRTNCWWDVNLRRRYIGFVRTLFWGFALVLILLSVSTGLTVSKVLAMLACSIRLIAWGLNESDTHAAAAERVAGIHYLLSRFPDNQPPSPVDSRHIQDAIFEHRSSTPPVPDWFYWWHRKSQEQEAGAARRRRD